MKHLSDKNGELTQAQQQFKEKEQQLQQQLTKATTELTHAQQQLKDTQTKLKKAEDSVQSQQKKIDVQVKAEVEKRMQVAIAKMMSYATTVSPDASPVASPVAPDEPEASQSAQVVRVHVRTELPAPLGGAAMARAPPSPVAALLPAATAMAPQAPGALASAVLFSY